MQIHQGFAGPEQLPLIITVLLDELSEILLPFRIYQ
jgi:hypothetical protein